MSQLCDVCAQPLDDDRLRIGPLKRICLECLSVDERRALEHDLESAARVQAGLLPARNFSFGRWQIHYHYQPLGAVSGDQIDLIRPERTGDAMHFLFGDVSGKGIAASILMASLQALFRSLVSQELALPEIVGRANRIFAESTRANSFATLVAGRLNGSGSLEIVNAGHNPPLLVRDGTVRALTAAALPLGFSPATRFESQRFELGDDDFLFLYTDGVSEACNGLGEEYGESRVHQALAELRGREAREVVRSVLERVEAFQDGTPGSDDSTAMAIRWRGSDVQSALSDAASAANAVAN
jgi:sigma-B regulation protein RsbU (phosphoserine phosphatase)